MAITVRLFANFREAAGEKQAQVEGAKDVASLLDELVSKFGDPLSEQLYSPGARELRNTVNILVNGVSARQGVETPLKDGDEVAIFPPVSGG